MHRSAGHSVPSIPRSTGSLRVATTQEVLESASVFVINLVGVVLFGIAYSFLEDLLPGAAFVRVAVVYFATLRCVATRFARR